MSQGTLGCAIVIGNSHYQRGGDLPGVANDVKIMDACFKRLGYTVISEMNISADNILLLCDRVLHEYYSRRVSSGEPLDSVAFYFSGHGNKNIILGTDWDSCDLHQLSGKFKTNGDLRGKPKLFFIDACRGDLETMGIVKDAGSLLVGEEADCVFAFATPENYCAVESRKGGVWTAKLAHVLTKQYQQTELVDMLRMADTEVKQAFARLYNQAGCTELKITGLGKKVYFPAARSVAQLNQSLGAMTLQPQRPQSATPQAGPSRPPANRRWPAKTAKGADCKKCLEKGRDQFCHHHE